MAVDKFVTSKVYEVIIDILIVFKKVQGKLLR
jgi:hypothetical protein